RGRPLLHEHQKCGHQFNPVMICSECNEPLLAKEVHVHPGPGARPKAIPPKPAKVAKAKTSRAKARAA
ncbi:MAG: winged helix-turn-helix transcriptional regulator, partial [Afipia sp.]